MMTPEARRTPPPAGSEADILLGLLNYGRDTLRWKCSGLGDEQLRQPMAPTSMTLAGLILHLTIVEAGWFNLSFAGGVSMPSWMSIADLEDPDWAWQHAQKFRADQLWGWFDEATGVSDKVIADTLEGGEGLERRAVNPEEPVSMRWLITHMVEEYARHNGHADLLRESIDGATGD